MYFLYFTNITEIINLIFITALLILCCNYAVDSIQNLLLCGSYLSLLSLWSCFFRKIPYSAVAIPLCFNYAVASLKISPTLLQLFISAVTMLLLLLKKLYFAAAISLCSNYAFASFEKSPTLLQLFISALIMLLFLLRNPLLCGSYFSLREDRRIISWDN